ncbi:MacB-like periplasmic core domain protein [Candidatus Tiddalikarchaeum anstoanum]|nr:MacB-like periplasmic core domain protein [Candidatus Tiddalikarchaeum anstoanum]
MRFNDIINFAFKNVGFKGLRSWLTIIGIIVGIASVVGLMTYSESISATINNQLSNFNSQTITISPGSPVRSTETRFMRTENAGLNGGFSAPRSASTTTGVLKDSDVLALEQIDGIIAVSPLYSQRLSVTYEGQIVNNAVNFITPSQYSEVNTITLSDGTFLNDGDSQIVIGYGLANSSFNTPIKVGDELLISSKYYKVEGILAEGGFGSNDNSILMDIGQASMISNFSNSYNSIQLKASSIDVIAELTPVITQVLDNERGIISGQEDFQVSSFTSVINSVSTMINTLSLFLIGIAAISLLVGAISIANTMFTSVFEKTRDIGIMKALGAKDSDILSLFVTESSIISLIGGLGGIVLGLLIAQVLVSFSSNLTSMQGGAGSSALAMVLVVKPELIALALLISLGIGIVSGYLPARQASRLNPIEAIWYE